MTDFRFHLEKYRPGNRYECPACGRKKCFARYVDEQGEITLPEQVGRCDHENKCGYHYSPKDYFRDNPDRLPKREHYNGYPVADVSCYRKAVKPSILAPACNHRMPMPNKSATANDALPSFIDHSLVDQSLSCYDINPLFTYLTKVMNRGDVAELFARYRVGTSKEWGGSTVFWQTDIEGHVRTGKIMRYDPETGHRVKGETDRITWVHAKLRLPDFHLRQCFFGEHLLVRYPNKPVAIVESEKTALIAAHFIKEPIWIATGGKHGCLNERAISALKGRRVTLFPDLGAEDVWRSKLSLLTPVCRSVAINNILEREATEEQRRSGLDLADFLLKGDSARTILDRMIACNPALQILIDKLDLELVEEG